MAVSSVAEQKKEQTSSSQWHSDQRETLCELKKPVGEYNSGRSDLDWMFALIDPAGESSMGPRTWDQRLGAFTKGQ